MKAGRDVNRCKFLSICLFRDGNNLVLVESIEIQKLNFPNLTSKNFNKSIYNRIYIYGFNLARIISHVRHDSSLLEI